MYAIALWLALVLGWYLLAGRGVPVAFGTVVLAWILMNPWWGGNPRILRSVERGGVYGENAIIPWATTSITYPETVVRAKSELEVVKAVRDGAYPVGSGHSFDDLFDREMVVLMDYCTMDIVAARGEADITVSGGCMINRVREYAHRRGFVMRGLGAIYQQTVGGGLATSLHNDERGRFADEVLNVTYVSRQSGSEGATGNVSEVEGTTGDYIFLTVTVRLHEPFSVKRVTQEGGWDVVQAALNEVENRTAEAGGGQTIVARGDTDPEWLAWKMTASPLPLRPAELPLRGTPRRGAAGQGEYTAFVLDNIITPLLTYAPWAAALPPGGGGDPFVYQTDDDGMIDWFYAQEHFPGSVLPTGEIRTRGRGAAPCKDVVDTLIGIARNYGELSLMVRPAEGGCWVDYGVFPWAPAATRDFHTEVAVAVAANAASWEFHKGKIRPRVGAAHSRGYLVVLEFQRIFWIVAVTAFISLVVAHNLRPAK